jgi:alanyl-tRNA synthetase
LNKEKLVQLKDKIIQNLEIASGINLGCSIIDIKPTLLKELCFTMANEKDNLFLILACKDLDKIYCSCYISKNLVSSRGVNASDVISNLSKIIDGKGGGQPFYATCSGTKINSLNKLISSAAELQKLLIK